MKSSHFMMLNNVLGHKGIFYVLFGLFQITPPESLTLTEPDALKFLENHLPVRHQTFHMVDCHISVEYVERKDFSLQKI